MYCLEANNKISTFCSKIVAGQTPEVNTYQLKAGAERILGGIINNLV